MLRKAIKEQRSVMQAYPSGPPRGRSRKLARLATTLAASQRRRAATSNSSWSGCCRSEARVWRPSGESPGRLQRGACRGFRRRRWSPVMPSWSSALPIIWPADCRASVEVDDLIQAGMIGLLEAASRFSSDRGASFETYAGIRIRGAMIDALRKLDWAPRSVHRKARDAAAAIREIEGGQGPRGPRYRNCRSSACR